jgi:methylase of polypeptide subunit release factors
VSDGLGGAAVAAAPPPAGSAADVAALRAALDAAGYDGPSVRAALHTERSLIATNLDAAVVDRRLESAPAALAALVRLFVLGANVPLDELALDPELLTRVRLADEVGGELCPRVRLVPHDALLVASDRAEYTEGDHAAGVHRPSATLAALTVRRTVARTLDLGTGCGVQAMLAAPHCERVVATDVNERALAFAEFNASLNAVTNIEFRAGSFFEPVHGERFDLVVSNPPYVISPETELVFRDSGKPGDTVSAELVAELPEHLTDGGFGTIMVSWIGEDDLFERPRRWLAGSACDALVLYTGGEDALTSATAWNRAAGTDPERFAERLDRWLAYYTALGIERIAYGVVILRRRAAAEEGWIRFAELPPDRLRAASDHLQRIFDASLDGLLDRPLALVGDAYLDRTVRLDEGAWQHVAAAVRLDNGIGFGVNLDRAGLAIVSLLDGSGPLRPRLPALARELEAPEHELTRFAEELLEHLVVHGYAAN